MFLSTQINKKATTQWDRVTLHTISFKKVLLPLAGKNPTAKANQNNLRVVILQFHAEFTEQLHHPSSPQTLGSLFLDELRGRWWLLWKLAIASIWTIRSGIHMCINQQTSICASSLLLNDAWWNWGGGGGSYGHYMDHKKWYHCKKFLTIFSWSPQLHSLCVRDT